MRGLNYHHLYYFWVTARLGSLRAAAQRLHLAPQTMSDQIKIRAQIQGEITDLRILMQHPMETGQRKDEKGQTLPMHFIQTFSVLHNGKLLIDGQLNTSVSKNPLFTFKARGIKAGDKISVNWTDNNGAKRQDEITIV